MSSESLDFRKDITDTIRELGEKFTFTRGHKTLATLYSAQGKIEMKNIDAGAASSMQNQSRLITVEYSSVYVPEISDKATDTHGNIFTIQSLQSVRFQDTAICYIVVIV